MLTNPGYISWWVLGHVLSIRSYFYLHHFVAVACVYAVYAIMYFVVLVCGRFFLFCSVFCRACRQCHQKFHVMGCWCGMLLAYRSEGIPHNMYLSHSYYTCTQTCRHTCSWLERLTRPGTMTWSCAAATVAVSRCPGPFGQWKGNGSKLLNGRNFSPTILLRTLAGWRFQES